MATRLTSLRSFGRPLLANTRSPLRTSLYQLPNLNHQARLSFRLSHLSTSSTPTPPPQISNPRALFNKSPILAFTRGLRSALERTPIRRAVRPERSSLTSGSGGSGGGLIQSWKRRIDNTSPDYIFYAIVGINGIVFLMWGWGQENYQKFRDPGPLTFMYNNFTTSWRNVMDGRVWTLLTACFSHEATGHLLVNGMSFWFMAPPVMRMLGNSAFLALYLGGGAAASAFSLAWNAVISQKSVNAHGASGAIYSVISLFACLFPSTTFLLFFIVPVPAWLCVSGIFAYDFYGALKRRGGMTDSAGHMGGVLAGVAYFLRMRSRLRIR